MLPTKNVCTTNNKISCSATTPTTTSNYGADPTSQPNQTKYHQTSCKQNIYEKQMHVLQIALQTLLSNRLKTNLTKQNKFNYRNGVEPTI